MTMKESLLMGGFNFFDGWKLYKIILLKNNLKFFKFGFVSFRDSTSGGVRFNCERLTLVCFCNTGF